MKNRVKKLCALLLAFSMVFGIGLVPSGNAEMVESPETVNITILGTSDVHAFVYPWEYKLGVEDSDAGLAKVYSVVKEVREENPEVLLIDNGDTIQGTELTDVYKNDESSVFPMIDVMNFMAYDSLTLGNHEFNYGLDVLERIMADAEFPVIAANVYNDDGSNYVLPYIVKEIDGVKIGILGMVTPNIPRWDGDKVENLEFVSLIDDAKKWVKVLREDEKVDIVIASIHAGVEPEYWEDGGDGVRAVAEQVPEIDAILAGHAHEDIEGELINGVLIAEPKRYGNRVTRFDFIMEKNGDYWDLKEKTSYNYDTNSYEAAPEILDLAEEYHQATLDYVNTPIGEATGDFVPVGEIMGIPTAQIQDTALVDFINKVQMKYTGADVSLAALFISESNLLEGPLTIKDAAYIYKYDNTLYETEVTGAELKSMMEWSANYFNTYKPGDVTISFNPDIRGYNYDMFSGVEYDIDISEEPGSRIKNLMFEGVPVTEDMEFTLALNNYRYGGMSKDGYISGDIIFDSYEEYGDDGQIRNLIAKYIKEEEAISPEVDNNWEIIGADLKHWGREDAVELLNDGIMDIPVSEDGRTPNVKAVNLEEKVTRGEFIEVLVKALGLALTNVETTQFSDVDAELAPYVEAAVDAKITEGVSETMFDANGTINREQSFSMLMRSMGSVDDSDSTLLDKFMDKDEISDWAKEEMAKAVEMGIVEGYMDGTVKPGREMSRGEMAKIISEAFID